MDQALYTVRSVIKMLSVSRATVYRMISRGELEVVKVGKSTRITGGSIDKMIRAQNPSWPADEEVLPHSVQQQGKVNAPAAAQGRDRDRERNLEKRVAALEREVASLRKLISKIKEAINE